MVSDFRLIPGQGVAAEVDQIFWRATARRLNPRRDYLSPVMPLNLTFNWYIRRRMAQIDLARREPVESQRALLAQLLTCGAETAFGREHGLAEARNLRDFKERVPVRPYDALKPWIERAIAGEEDVLWPGRTPWFAKSSGTTSDRSKYLPVTEEALREGHFKGGKDLLALFCEQRPGARLYEGHHLVLGGGAGAGVGESAVHRRLERDFDERIAILG